MPVWKPSFELKTGVNYRSGKFYMLIQKLLLGSNKNMHAYMYDDYFFCEKLFACYIKNI